MNNQESEIKKTSQPAHRQPTATELSQQAIMLAQARKKPITPENREEFLRAAYDLWRAADDLIRQRESIAEQEANARESDAWEEIAASLDSEDIVTFKTMVGQKMLPRRGSGEKSDPFISSVEGAKKAFRLFCKSVCGAELAVGETKAVGSAALLLLEEPCAQVLKSGAMSRALFAEFLAWQKEPCSPKKAVQRKKAKDTKAALSTLK